MVYGDGQKGKGPIIDLGDTVCIEGFGLKNFIVFAISRNKEINALEVFEHTYYDVADIDVVDGEYDNESFLYIGHEDVTTIEKSTDVDYEELRDLVVLSHEASEEMMAVLEAGAIMNYEDNHEEYKALNRPVNNEVDVDKVDEMLDEINDWKELISMFGDEDGYYDNKIKRIENRLRHVTKGSDK